MPVDYADAIARDVRLIILKALLEQPNNALNSKLLVVTLETYGHHFTRTYVHNQLKWLAENAGAVTVTDADTIKIAKLTEAGRLHVQDHKILEGIDRPGLAE